MKAPGGVGASSCHGLVSKGRVRLAGITPLPVLKFTDARCNLTGGSRGDRARIIGLGKQS